MMDYGMGIECGQRLFCSRSWKRTAYDDNVFRFRKFKRGFAFGPVMFWKSS